MLSRIIVGASLDEGKLIHGIDTLYIVIHLNESCNRSAVTLTLETESSNTLQLTIRADDTN